VNELCGNVYENKGPAFSSAGRSGNVIEKKGSYAFKPGMLVKRKDVGGRWRRIGFRIQESGVRSQKSGARSENEEHLLPAFCFLLLKGRRSGQRDLRYACLLPTAYCIWGAVGRAKNPHPCSPSPGNLFGLICFESKCRLSGRLEEESLSSRWG